MSKQWPTSDYLDAFLHLLFPNICACCAQRIPARGRPICFLCHRRLPLTGFEVMTENPFTDRFWGRLPLIQGLAGYWFKKGNQVQTLLHQLKYQGRPDLGIFAGTELGAIWKDSGCLEAIDLIIPVPLHPKKKRLRGYNQSEAFATGLSQALDKPAPTDLLKRQIHTSSQTRKDRFERLRNMEGIFETPKPERLQGQHVLLVDDVLTTGATLEACALTLLQVPEVQISMATIAIADL